MYAAIILIGIIGLITDLVLASLGRQLFPWRRAPARGGTRRWCGAIKRRGRGPTVGAGLAFGKRGASVTRSAEAICEQAPEVAARFARIKQRPVILDVKGLSKTFTSSGRPPTLALDNVSVQVHRRELMCVIGPSGCGKSTLARIVAGLEEPTGGEMLLDGKPIQGPGPDRGMVFQGYTLFPWLTVLRT